VHIHGKGNFQEWCALITQCLCIVCAMRAKNSDELACLDAYICHSIGMCPILPEVPFCSLSGLVKPNMQARSNRVTSQAPGMQLQRRHAALAHWIFYIALFFIVSLCIYPIPCVGAASMRADTPSNVVCTIGQKPASQRHASPVCGRSEGGFVPTNSSKIA